MPPTLSAPPVDSKRPAVPALSPPTMSAKRVKKSGWRRKGGREEGSSDPWTHLSCSESCLPFPACRWEENPPPRSFSRFEKWSFLLPPLPRISLSRKFESRKFFSSLDSITARTKEVMQPLLFCFRPLLCTLNAKLWFPFRKVLGGEIFLPPLVFYSPVSPDGLHTSAFPSYPSLRHKEVGER